jgi:hypothetical protein
MCRNQHRRGRAARKPWTAAFVLSLLGGCLPQFAAAADSSLEYQVKAAFLLNFTKFIEWPPSAFVSSEAPLQICILGNDPFGRALDAVVQGETVNGHRLAVRRITDPPAAQTCQVLFVGAELKGVRQLLMDLPRGIVTVGEGDRFLREGGMIALVLDNRRVRFDIDQTAAANGDLKLSSKLLSVARSVNK